MNKIIINNMNGILIAVNGYDMLKAYYAILRALYKYS